MPPNTLKLKKRPRILRENRIFSLTPEIRILYCNLSPSFSENLSLLTEYPYLEVIKNIRNVCAHSNVLYDFTPEKSIRKGPAMMRGIGDNQNLNGAVRVIIYMLKQISEKHAQELKKEIDILIIKYGDTAEVRNILLNISGFRDFHRY